MTLLFQPLSVVMTVVPILLKIVRSSEDAANQKDYHKWSLCVIVCCIVKIYQSTTAKKKVGYLLTRTTSSQLKYCKSCVVKIYQLITAKKSWLLTYQDNFFVAKILQKLHRKRISNWTMVSFICNGSEITTWMCYTFFYIKKNILLPDPQFS